MNAHLHRAPVDCPVCGDRLATTRLGCQSCGTELVGLFESCPFCALDDADRDLLTVFLTSNGNLRSVEKHLGVSYPTARSRYQAVLAKLGLSAEAAADGPADAAQDDDQQDDARPGDAGEVLEGALEDEVVPGATGAAGDSSVRDQVLAQVASGALTPDAAADLLRQLGHSA